MNPLRRARRRFVQVGDKVEAGQVLCIIEAMKLMNEIEAEAGGVISKRFVANGQPVEYGEALFAIDTRGSRLAQAHVPEGSHSQPRRDRRARHRGLQGSRASARSRSIRKPTAARCTCAMPMKLLCIGPPRSADSYLNIPAVISAAEITDVDAIHPGYGFLAEDPGFAEVCEVSGIKFIGPRPDVIRLMGDKAQARRTAEKGGDSDRSRNRRAGQDRGRSAQLGQGNRLSGHHQSGGRRRRARHARGAQRRQAGRALSSGAARGRHQLPLLGGLHRALHRTPAPHRVPGAGRRDTAAAWRSPSASARSSGGTRNCSKRGPRPGSIAATRERMCEVVGKALSGDRLLQCGNGRVPDGSEGRPLLHRAECADSGRASHDRSDYRHRPGAQPDSAGERRAARRRAARKNRIEGHAIECRINAENPQTFAPSAGRISQLVLPGGIGVRVDTAAYSGWFVPPYYDSLVAKLVVHGKDREEAIARMRRALDFFSVEGIHTSISLHQRILADPEFQAGRYDTHFIERLNAQRAAE